jgi:hypothetical protein
MGSTFIRRRDNDHDWQEEDNFMVVIVLAHAGNHGVLDVIVIIIVAVTPWLRQQWVPVPPPPNAMVTDTQLCQRQWMPTWVGSTVVCHCNGNRTWSSLFLLVLAIAASLLLSPSSLLLRGFNHDGYPPLLLPAQQQLMRNGINIGGPPWRRVSPSSYNNNLFNYVYQLCTLWYGNILISIYALTAVAKKKSTIVNSIERALTITDSQLWSTAP